MALLSATIGTANLRFQRMLGIEWNEIKAPCTARKKTAATWDTFSWKEMSRTQDLYERLEVSRRASPAAIKRAYRTLIEKYHPDRQPEHLKLWADGIAQQLNEAYSQLRDAESRAAYDQRHSI